MTDATLPAGRRRPRPALLAPAGAAIAVATVLAVVLLPDRDRGDAPSAGDTEAESAATATAERRDLVDRESVSGTLGYGDQRDIASPRDGTVTRLPAAGTVIERGQSLFEISGEPVPYFYGDVPLYRALSTGVDDGPDVRQLEENLAALGFASQQMKVDEHFDSATASAVRAWQKSLGRDQTGSVAPGDLVFGPGPVRVAEPKVQVGASAGPGTPVLGVTGTTRLVTINLEASRQTLAQPGAKARVRLPGDQIADATVWSVGTVATQADENSATTIPVVVVLDDPAAGGSLSEAPVTVDLTRETAVDVLAVPVRALLALSEGGYAVEVLRDGRHELVGVEVGAFADGYVEITGDVREGEKVVVAQ